MCRRRDRRARGPRTRAQASRQGVRDAHAAGIDPRSLDSSEFETESFIGTGCGDLEWRSDDGFVIYRRGGEGYLFRLLVGPGAAESTSNDES